MQKKQIKSDIVRWQDRKVAHVTFAGFTNHKLGKTFKFYSKTWSTANNFQSDWIQGTSERLGEDTSAFRISFLQPVEKNLYIVQVGSLDKKEKKIYNKFLTSHTVAHVPETMLQESNSTTKVYNQRIRARIDPRYVTEFEDPEKVKKLKITLRCFDPRTNPKIFQGENSVDVDDCHPSEPWTFTFSKDNYNVDHVFHVHFTATCYIVSNVKEELKKSIVCHPSDQFVSHIAVFYRDNVQNEFKFYQFQFLTADDTLPQGSYYPSKKGTGEILFFSYDPWLFKRLLISRFSTMKILQNQQETQSLENPEHLPWRISYERASKDYYELDYRKYSDDFRAPSPPIAEIGSRFDVLLEKGKDPLNFATKINDYFRVKHYDPREYYTIPTMTPNSKQCYEKWEGSGLSTKELEDLSFYLKYSFETIDYKQILNCRDGEIFVTAASKGRNQYCGISLCFNIFRLLEGGKQSKKCETYKTKIEAEITKITKVTKLEKYQRNLATLESAYDIVCDSEVRYMIRDDPE